MCPTMAAITCVSPTAIKHSPRFGRVLPWFLCLLLTAVGASAAQRVTVSGRVFADRNRDGVAQASEPGMARVVVSDGKAVVVTSRTGEYSLEADAGRHVFVSLPKGFRATRSFYATAAVGRAMDFGLVDWPESRKSAVRFVQITDLHVAASKDTVSTFVEDIQEINALQPAPAFVMTTGDLVNVGKETVQYENYVEGIAAFRLPLFNLPGNHDIHAPGSLEHYHHYLGPDHYSFNVGDCHLVMLNCMDFGDQQKEWVLKDLAASPKGATRFFALHFLPTRQQVEWMRSLGAAAVLSGHWHGNRVEQGQGLLDMNTPPLRFGGIDRHPRSFRIIDVKGGKVTDELRLGGFKQHAVVVAPAGTCTPANRKLPVVVNAYDTRCEIASVEGWFGGERVRLKRVSPWSWMGELKLPADAGGAQLLTANVHSDNGEAWTTKSSFVIAPEPEKGSLRLKWATPTGGFIGISSARASATCVAVGVDDKGDLKSCGVSAFGVNGKRLWHYATDSGIKNNIATDNGRLYATSVAGWLYALDEASGKLLWKAELDRKRERWEVAATTVADGLVYVGSSSYVAAFDAQTGNRIWDTQLGATDWWPSCYTIPTVAQGKLILGARAKSTALDAKTGKPSWKLEGKFNRCVAVGDMIYAVRNDALCALKVADGKVAWTSTVIVGDTASTPAVAGEKVVVGTADGRICAFAIKDGTLLWSAQTGTSLSTLQPYQRGISDVNSSPAILGDSVYVGASDGKIHVLALGSGKETASYTLGTPIGSSPCIAGDTLYIGAYDGNLYAFALGQ